MDIVINIDIAYENRIYKLEAIHHRLLINAYIFQVFY